MHAFETQRDEETDEQTDRILIARRRLSVRRPSVCLTVKRVNCDTTEENLV